MKFRSALYFAISFSLVFLGSGSLEEGWLTGVSSVVSAQDKKEEKPSDKPDVIYVPFKELGKTLERITSSVMIPYADYLKLMNEKRLANPQNGVPVSVVISKSNYVTTIKGDLASIQAELEINSLVEGWSLLPIQFGNAAIGSWKCDVKGVLLQGGKKGESIFLLPKKGAYKLTIDLVAKVKKSPEGDFFEMKSPFRRHHHF